MTSTPPGSWAPPTLLEPSLPAPAALVPHRTRRPRRPRFALVVVLAVIVRLLVELGGWIGLVTVLMLGTAAIGWRLWLRRRAKRRGVQEMTPDMVRRQIEASGLSGPAFRENGSLPGASLIAVTQRSKLIEVRTEYQLFDASGRILGHVRQIGQSRWKQFFRFTTAFDQYFTHHFDITDADDRLVLRVTRPRKLFKSRVEVFDGNDRFLGRVVQENVFGKIHFGIHSASGERIAAMRAENWRAWDFVIELPSGVVAAHVVKTWEGFARTYFTNADQYVVRIAQVLGEPLRSLVLATALSVDLALKQDPRGFGAV